MTKTLTIKEFMDLWANVISGKWNDIAPNLGKEIRKIWGDEIMMRFEESKGAGSYGGYGGSENLALLLRTGSGAGSRVTYNEDYAKRHGGKTFVKTGDLQTKMQQEIEQGAAGFDTNGKLMTRINIPEMTNEPLGPNVQWNWEYCYAHLEEWRSFIRSSLLIAWPTILKHVINSIG